MKKHTTILTALFITACLFGASDAAVKNVKPHHKEAGISCEDCHGVKTPSKEATEEQCLSCHESRDAVAERTGGDDPNPHFGHDESISCGDCHKEHEDSVLYCDDCHQWGYSTP